MNIFASGALALALWFCHTRPATGETRLEQDWTNPPQDARLRAYWWWLNGNVTEQAITTDLEQMKAKGFGGALICDADGSSQDGNARAPHGPTFMSADWRKLYKHTLREADRLGLEMSLNIQSGWNLGGPMVTKDDAPKQLVWTETRVSGGSNVSTTLETPKGREDFYKDLFLLAYPVRADLPKTRKPITNLLQKSLRRPLTPSSAPSSKPLFEELPDTAGEEDAQSSSVLDLASHLSPAGALKWQAPAGDWQLIRIGYTLNDHCRVSTCSEGWDGYALDPFDAGAFQRYWDAVVEPLIADAGELTGKSLKYLHTDSWEVEVANWTPSLRDEFRKRRGYDLLPWLPVITGRIINSRDQSNRFLHDFRRTLGDLAIDHHFKLFKEGAHRHGLLIHPESGGPHAVPIDAQQCLGNNDAPMSEFWASSWRHRIGDGDRFFVKQPASAAHVYGHKLVLAEGFTTIGPHWQETLWDNLKPAFDHALTEGLNLVVWHAFVCSPKEQGLPGQQYFAGTHLNPEVTWWSKSEPFFAYINRCQALLQRGLPVGDVAYYYGDHVPNFTQLRSSDPAHLGAGYDYDVLTEEAVLNRVRVQDGKITLPDGVTYHALVLPDRDVISLAVLKKVASLVREGATVIGPRPRRAATLSDFEKTDAEIQRLANELWASPGSSRHVLTNKTAREVLLQAGVQPDFESGNSAAKLDYIHRRDGDTEIYFVASRTNIAQAAECSFRVHDKAPELWDPVSGEHRFAQSYRNDGRRTALPLSFNPCGSWFVVFREPAGKHIAVAQTNERELKARREITGPWDVSFDAKWGGPSLARFDQLVSWTAREEPGIKFYSGTATYRNRFEFQRTSGGAPGGKAFLELGNVRELAEIKVNGKSCGVTWTPPFRLEVTDALREGANNVEIEVVNFWPNRVVGDSTLPQEKRLTKTNIRKLTSQTNMMTSGLLGPVRLLTESKP